MYDNIPNRFVPDEHVPEQFFAHPLINKFAYNRRTLNATHTLLATGVEHYSSDRVAIRSLDTDESINFGQLQERVHAIAGVLESLDLEPGDRVCCRLSETLDAVATQYAVWQLGGVVVPCPIAARAKEIEYYLRDTESRFILSSELDVDQMRAAVEDINTLEQVVVTGNPLENEHSLTELLTATTKTTDYATTHPFDAASIFYTGGTTGKPKGSIHSHVAEVAITMLECVQGRDLSPDDTLFCPAPIGHSLGNGEKINFPFRFGASTILTRRPSPSDMVDIIEEQDVTIFVGSPTMLRMMMETTTLENRDLSSLRLVIVGGEMFDEETYQSWIEKTGIEPCNTVGMSQLRHWFLTPYRDGEKYAPDLSVGQPYGGFEMKLVEVDNPQNDIDSPGNVGRLAIRGPTNITYWNNIHPDMPEVMADYSIGSWGLADDAYRLDEDGLLYFETRLDNMIVSGGRQISGPEVEDTLIGHEFVKDVAVVGSPDETRGEIVKAFVIPSDYDQSEDRMTSDLQEYVKEQIAPYKYPRKIEFLDELPTDEMGKIQRAELRDRERSSK